MTNPYGPYDNIDSAGNRYIPAPVSNLSSSGGVLGVWLNEDEEVEWSIGFVNGHQYVYGYTIKKRKHNNKGQHNVSTIQR